MEWASNTPNVSLWRDRRFLILFTSFLLSGIGSGLNRLAAAWYTYEFTRSYLATGMLYVCFNLPGVFLGPLSGALADRYSKRRILIGVRLVQAAIVSGFIFAHQSGSIGLFLGLTVFAGGMKSFYDGPFNAYVPETFANRHIENINTIFASTRMLATAIGALLAAPVLASGNVEAAFIANAITFFLSGISFLFIPAPTNGVEKIKSDTSGLYYETTEGIARLFRPGMHRTILVLTLVLYGIYSLSLAQIMPYCKDILSTASSIDSGALLSSVETTIGIGGLLAGLFTTVLIGRVGFIGTIIIGAILGAFQFLVMGFVQDLNIVLITLLLSAGCTSMLQVPLLSAMQKWTDIAIMGRIISIIQTILLLVVSASYGLGSVIAHFFSIETLLRFNGALLIFVALVFLLWVIRKNPKVLPSGSLLQTERTSLSTEHPTVICRSSVDFLLPVNVFSPKLLCPGTTHRVYWGKC